MSKLQNRVSPPPENLQEPYEPKTVFIYCYVRKMYNFHFNRNKLANLCNLIKLFLELIHLLIFCHLIFSLLI